MAVLSATYLLGTLAVQIGSACFNSQRSTKQSKELARKQQEYEERVLREGIENAREEFAELCALQRQIEIGMQHDRLQMLRDNHLSSLRLEAYRQSLKDWPLLVPPSVIKNECLPLLEFEERQQVTTIPVNCIMTPSMDSKFNLKIFLALEEKLAQFFSKYWRSNDVKAIRFYQQAWRNQMTDVGSKMRDLKTHLKDIPTIVLSPLIEDDRLKFRFYWWGMSDKPEDEHIIDPNNIYDPELSISLKPNMEYTDDDVKIIIEEATAKVAAFVSYFADLYYWNFYRFAPTLPNLVSNDVFAMNAFIVNCLSIYEKNLVQYVEQRKRNALNYKSIIDMVQAIKSINQDSKIAEELIGNLLNMKERLSSVDIPLLSNLSHKTATRIPQVDKTLTQLQSMICSSTLPCFTSNELFYYIKSLYSTYINPSIKVYVHTNDGICLAVFALDEDNKYAYTINNEKYLFIVFNRSITSNRSGFFEVDFVKSKLIKVKSAKVLSLIQDLKFNYNTEALNKTLSFINKIEQISPNVLQQLDKTNAEDKGEQLTLNDIVDWIKVNHTYERQFVFMICYDNSSSNYYYIGSFRNDDSYAGDNSFFAYSKFLSKELYQIMNYNCAYFINIK